MTNEKIIKALKTIKTYSASTLLEELECAIKIIEKLEREGISKPLETDFTKLAETEAK